MGEIFKAHLQIPRGRDFTFLRHGTIICKYIILYLYHIPCYFVSQYYYFHLKYKICFRLDLLVIESHLETQDPVNQVKKKKAVFLKNNVCPLLYRE